MQGSTKTFSIGLFVLITLIILAAVIIWLKPTIGDEGLTLHVRFINLDKINDGTRVNFAGQPVGSVYQILEIPDAREATHDGRVYIYEVILKVDSHLDVYKTDRFSIKTSGLLGERSIEITPVAPREGQILIRATPDDVLFACSTGSVEEAFDQIGRLSNTAQGVINKISDALDKLDDNKFWENMASGMDHFESLASALDQPELIEESIENLHDFSENLKLTGEDIVKSAEKVSHLTDLLDKIVIKVEAGEGTFGRLLGRDDLYLNVKAVVHKAETLVNDINHFGLLYQNDKKWQRLRARRANLMADLRNPQEFKAFFEEEVDSVALGLARLESVLDECPDNSEEFACLFRDLIRRVEGLDEQLKNYNVELQESLGECCR